MFSIKIRLNSTNFWLISTNFQLKDEFDVNKKIENGQNSQNLSSFQIDFDFFNHLRFEFGLFLISFYRSQFNQFRHDDSDSDDDFGSILWFQSNSSQNLGLTWFNRLSLVSRSPFYLFAGCWSEDCQFESEIRQFAQW